MTNGSGNQPVVTPVPAGSPAPSRTRTHIAMFDLSNQDDLNEIERIKNNPRCKVIKEESHTIPYKYIEYTKEVQP